MTNEEIVAKVVRESIAFTDSPENIGENLKKDIAKALDLKEQEVWAVANTELRKQRFLKRKWIRKFTDEIKTLNRIIVNRKMDNSYKFFFMRKVKEYDSNLYFRIYEELKPLWADLQKRRMASLEQVEKGYTQPKWVGIFDADKGGKNGTTDGV